MSTSKKLAIGHSEITVTDTKFHHNRMVGDLSNRTQEELQQSFLDFIKELLKSGTLNFKTLKISICLSIVSVILLITGFVEDIVSWDPLKGGIFWILSAIVGCPGFFVIY